MPSVEYEQSVHNSNKAEQGSLVNGSNLKWTRDLALLALGVILVCVVIRVMGA